eukprot:SAG31_NODE_1194_length_9448_cov_9.896887_7_plen_270_part_00
MVQADIHPVLAVAITLNHLTPAPRFFFFFFSSGHLKLADFGLARPLLHGSRARTRCGTDEYMSPELLSNKGVTFASDWWALGVILYEIAVGVTPFEALRRRSKRGELLFYLILKRDPPFPKTYRADPPAQVDTASACSQAAEAASPELTALLTALLTKNEEERLGSETQSQTIGIKAVQRARFFESVDWAAVATGKADPPLGFQWLQDESAAMEQNFSQQTAEAPSPGGAGDMKITGKEQTKWFADFSDFWDSSEGTASGWKDDRCTIS